MPGLGAFGLGTEWGESGIGFLGVRLGSGDHSILPRRFEITSICRSSAIQETQPQRALRSTEENRAVLFFFGINRFSPALQVFRCAADSKEGGKHVCWTTRGQGPGEGREAAALCGTATDC